MKTGMVKLAAIMGTAGLRLDAAHYLDPTLRIDQDIARTKNRCRENARRLRRLERERDRILAQKKAMGIE